MAGRTLLVGPGAAAGLAGSAGGEGSCWAQALHAVRSPRLAQAARLVKIFFGFSMVRITFLPLDLSLARGSAVVWKWWPPPATSPARPGASIGRLAFPGCLSAGGHSRVSGFGRCVDNVGRGATGKLQIEGVSHGGAAPELPEGRGASLHNATRSDVADQGVGGSSGRAPV